MHSRDFVDPTTGAHTQAFESYWSQVKTKLKSMRGTTDEMLGGHLDEYMWRERYGRGVNGKFDPKAAYTSLIADIPTQYPQPHWSLTLTVVRMCKQELVTFYKYSRRSSYSLDK